MIRIRWNIRLTERGSFILLWKIDKLCRDLPESINTTDQHSFTTEQGFSASIHIQIHLLIHISHQFFLVWHQQVPVQVLQPVFSSCVSSRAAGVGTLSASRDLVSLRDVLLSFYLYLQYLYLVLNDHILCSCKRTGISYLNISKCIICKFVIFNNSTSEVEDLAEEIKQSVTDLVKYRAGSIIINTPKNKNQQQQCSHVAKHAV